MAAPASAAPIAASAISWAVIGIWGDIDGVWIEPGTARVVTTLRAGRGIGRAWGGCLRGRGGKGGGGGGGAGGVGRGCHPGGRAHADARGRRPPPRRRLRLRRSPGR